MELAAILVPRVASVNANAQKNLAARSPGELPQRAISWSGSLI